MHRVTILGSGTSTGIPMVGCHCAVCNSSHPHNRRLRTSLLLTTASGKKILIDATPDLRTQLLAHQIDQLDAVMITHEHADHLHGIDDLRPLCFGQPPKILPVITHTATAQEMRVRFPYIFAYSYEGGQIPPKAFYGGGIPLLQLQELPIDSISADPVEITIADECFTVFLVPHGTITTLAFVHGKFAYLTDCHDITPAQIAFLQQQKLDLLILDCLRDRSHVSHLHYERAVALVAQIGARQSGLIHLSHAFDHVQLQARLDIDSPQTLVLYDGLDLEYSF